MTEDTIMRGFPPRTEDQVTLANWRQAPYSRWAFRNIRRLIPTAAVGRGDGPAWDIGQGELDLDRLEFTADGERRVTVDAAMAETCTDGLIVLHHGRVVMERYYGGFDSQTPHILFSVTKSVTGSLAGVLVDRGRLDPDAPVTEYLPETAGSAYGDARVRHVLDMNVGIDFVEDYTQEQGDMGRYRRASGWIPGADSAAEGGIRGFLPTLGKAGAHGEAFHYVSPNSDLMGWIIERAAGEPFATLLGRELWAPMGAEAAADLTLDPLGAPRTAGGLCTTLRDLARFGQMHLDGGLADGRQAIPASWIADIREGGDRDAWLKGDYGAEFPNGAYRSYWYAYGNDHAAYGGIGIHGQFVYVDPVADMVIAKFSSHPVAEDAAVDRLNFQAFHAMALALKG